MEIVRISGGDYYRYEELLLRRDAVAQEAQNWQRVYLRWFGDLINKVYSAKIESIQLKKAIAYCERALNRNEPVVLSELEQYLRREMQPYYQKLNEMVAEYEMCRKAGTLSEDDAMQVKKIYREIAKQLHPDISPLTAKYPELLDMWYRVVSAYNTNSLNELEELRTLINMFLERCGEEHAEMFIPDIGKKITALEDEIKKITSTKPYIYQIMYCSDELVEMRREELEEELEQFLDYCGKLTAILNSLKGGE